MNQKSNKLIKLAVRVTKRQFNIYLQDGTNNTMFGIVQIIYHRSEIQNDLDGLILIHI